MSVEGSGVLRVGRVRVPYTDAVVPETSKDHR